MKYLMKINLEYEIEANSREEATEILADKMEMENTSAGREFWDNIEVIGEDEVEFNI